MALNKSILEGEIKDLLNELKSDTNQEAAIDKFASMLAGAIDNYVKSAQVVGLDSVGGPITGTLE